MIGFVLFLGAAASAVCDDPQTQADMNICAQKDYAAADTDLNAQWAITAKRMKDYDGALDRSVDKRPGYFETLLKAQRAWIAIATRTAPARDIMRAGVRSSLCS